MYYIICSFLVLSCLRIPLSNYLPHHCIAFTIAVQDDLAKKNRGNKRNAQKMVKRKKAALRSMKIINEDQLFLKVQIRLIYRHSSE